MCTLTWSTYVQISRIMWNSLGTSILLEVNLMPCVLLFPATWQFISLQEWCQVHDVLWLIILYCIIINCIQEHDIIGSLTQRKFESIRNFKSTFPSSLIFLFQKSVLKYLLPASRQALQILKMFLDIQWRPSWNISNFSFNIIFKFTQGMWNIQINSYISMSLQIIVALVQMWSSRRP